jgi:hypothetical protein
VEEQKEEIMMVLPMDDARAKLILIKRGYPITQKIPISQINGEYHGKS